MSKTFFLLLVSTFSLWAIEWMSYSDALELQKKNGKIIMLDMVRSECHYCNEMELEVFENKEMIKWIDERFITVKINLDKDRIPRGIKVTFTPSFFFVDKNGSIVKKIPGAWNIVDFKDLTRGIK